MNICIEFDGIQHFEPVEHFGGVKAFKSLIKRDKIKNDYCQKNKINLLRIDYIQIDNIDNIISVFIDKINSEPEDLHIKFSTLTIESID